MASRQRCKRVSAFPGNISVATQWGPGAARNLGLAIGIGPGKMRGTMTQEQDNTTTMFETTNGVLDENNTLWNDIPAFADAVSRVKSGAAAIREKAGDQVPTGDTEAKAAAKLDLEERMLHIGDQLSALASKKGDYELAAKVDISKTAADRMSDSDLLTAAKGVSAGAAANATVLASDYKISAEELAALGAAITKFDGMKTAPREATVNRKVATLSLPEAVKFVRGIYRNELDKMMTRFKKTQPDFYKAYFAARVIVDRAATHAVKKDAPAPAPVPA
jgi:hypothetical protein